MLTRDSVCAGDDCDAPHTRQIETWAFLDPVTFANALSAGYLPAVAGSGHKWTCVLNGVKIAETSDAGTKPLTREVPFAGENHAHFAYHESSF